MARRSVIEARFNRPTRPAEAERARAPDPYPRRFTQALSDEKYRPMLEAAMSDGIGCSTRLRALVSLWQEDEALRVRVLERSERA